MSAANPRLPTSDAYVMNNTLNALLTPKSIVLVGASADINKLNGRPLHNLLRDGYAGRLYAVNPKYQDIAGIPCYPDLDSLPEIPELGVVAVAAERAIGVVAELGRRGVRIAIVFSSGFAEVGPEGRRLEQELVATARAHNIRICGPNNLGLINAFERMPLTFSQYADQPAAPGPVAFVTQSGAFGTAVATRARALGIGFGYFVSTGNEADITAVEVLDEILGDPRVTVTVVYLEGMRDGARLAAVADKALSLGKPLVVIKVGRFAAGKRAAISHTGSLAGEDAVFDGVIRQHGVIRAYDEVHALDLAAAFAACPVPPAGGIGLITMSGGAGVLMSDCAEELRLEVPVLSPHTQASLKSILPAFAATGNPVDVTAQGAVDMSVFGPTLNLVLADPNIGICIVWLQHMHRVADAMVSLFAQTRRDVAKPFIVCWLYAPEAAVAKLREAGVCVVEGTQRSIDAAAGLMEYGEARRRAIAGGRTGLPRGWQPAAAHSDKKSEVVPSIEAMGLLSAYGFGMVASRLAADPNQAAQSAEILGYPVAVKIESPDLPHKTEVGGVRLGLTSKEEVAAAASEVLAAARQHAPNAAIAGVLVQKMATPATEIVLGVRRDPSFGPVLMLGLGGVFIEVLKDVVFASAPVSEADAAFMLQRLRGRAILDGVRGRPGVDRASLTKAICALSQFALDHPEVAELDLNPVFAGPDGAVAVDWLMTRDSSR
ncbi:MAG: acetate--CoA ligase family protein [Burkholderiales bacterium]|nr:acetate--CoA ligase family protein [Burkholderiales bacterium]